MAKLKANKPTADVLMNSMRAMGYSFEAAIADIVDNSVSAQARNIVLRFPIDPSDCCVAVCDDGIGMNKKELLDAMKYGSQLKSANRSEDDLGRFGLGMKAASLSQCRRLTVASKKDCKLSAYVWDLDVIEEKKDWYMVDCSKEQIAEIRYIDFLSDKESGTIVLWENFDLIEKSSGNVYAELGKHQNATAEYLSLLFHRYLNGEGRNPLTIMVNNYKLTGLDPFLENHRKTNVRRKIEIPIKDSEGKEQIVSVQPFVLPFQKDLSAEDKRLSGGIENYRAKQGFYIYRNKRLIIWGTWFGRHRANGYTATSFKPAGAVNAYQYTEFVLRAMGYSSAANKDLSDTLLRAVNAGVLTDGDAAMLQSAAFLRAQLVYISYYALEADLPDGSQSLADRLMDLGVFTRDEWRGSWKLVKSERL